MSWPSQKPCCKKMLSNLAEMDHTIADEADE